MDTAIIPTDAADGPRIRRYRRPLNQAMPDSVPGYYADLAKPIWKWTLDDVLECATVRRNTPTEYPLDPDAFVAYLNRQEPSMLEAIANMVVRELTQSTAATYERHAVHTAAGLDLTTRDFSEKALAPTLDLLVRGLVVLPDCAYVPRPVWDDDDGGVDNVCNLVTPIWRYTLGDALWEGPGEYLQARRWLRRLDDRQRHCLDSLLAALSDPYEMELENHFSDYSRRVCDLLAGVMDGTVNPMTVGRSRPWAETAGAVH